MYCFKHALLTILVATASYAYADLFSPVTPPAPLISSLAELTEQAEITDRYDINADGTDDLIIRYHDSASNYGEFLYNVLISAEGGYYKGFSYDDYFTELRFENSTVTGYRRDDMTTPEKLTYIFRPETKTLQLVE